MQNIRSCTLSRSCLAFLRPSIYTFTFFQMKGVTEIHILCAFHEHNICNTEVLIIDNWNQPPRSHFAVAFLLIMPLKYSLIMVTVMVVTVFMTALFLKNCRQWKNWKFRPFFLSILPLEKQKIYKK